MQCNYNSFIQIINFHGLFRNAPRCRKTGSCRILVPLRYFNLLFLNILVKLVHIVHTSLSPPPPLSSPPCCIVQVIAIPAMSLTFYLDPPRVFAAMTVGTALSDSWPGVTISALSELVPSVLRPLFFAAFYCTINITGGTLNMALPALRHALGFRYAMIAAVIGLIALGTVLYILAWIALVCSKRPTIKNPNETECEDENDGKEDTNLTTPLIANKLR